MRVSNVNGPLVGWVHTEAVRVSNVNGPLVGWVHTEAVSNVNVPLVGVGSY